jgi:hypothetical protein
MAQLARTYGARMQSTPDGAAFDVVTGAADAGDARLREAARAIARTDLMDRFMKATRERLTAPAAPAAPAPDKTAATARPPAG